MSPCAGGEAMLSASPSSGVGVGGAAPRPASGSVQLSAILVNPFTATCGVVLLSHLGEKLVAQSALPSKCAATFRLVSRSGLFPFLSLVSRSPAPKAPRVKSTLEPFGDQTQLRSPTFAVVENGEAPVPFTLTV